MTTVLITANLFGVIFGVAGILLTRHQTARRLERTERDIRAEEPAMRVIHDAAQGDLVVITPTAIRLRPKRWLLGDPP